ncbi:molybdate ABC transporter substrate-binding protein [Demequina sp. NBRC 110053]|uniref:molybdate ABC transporter substrate-binding protein n=1 Tax=Demequina sp. NBRC 110053 TaxID=1570342 RepID=UPI000A058046|nr:molybdate ABC transporter substrate-binding protein [Demequina sp. NBRC 110053]
MSRPSALLGVTTALLLLPGCSSATADGDRQLTVYAAASLTHVFGELEQTYEAAHPGVDVVMVHGGSSELAATILEGAPADVFASANEAQMDAVRTEIATSPQVFATNTLTMIVEPGNPLGLSGLDDLAREDVASVVCAPQVPCGAATLDLASLIGVELAPSSQENSVTDVVGKVASGQADAGVVYVTEAQPSSGVQEVPLAGAAEVVSAYPIAAMAGGHSPDLGPSFVELVLSADGRAVLERAGFGAP